MLSEMILTNRIDWSGFFKEVEHDTFINRLKNEVDRKKEDYPGFEIINGKLMYKRRLVIPKTSSFIPIILQEYHASPMEGAIRLN